MEEINRSIVEDYFTMLKADVNGDLFSRADHRNRLQKELGLEDDDVIDATCGKISAVLSEIGLPVLDGFLPNGDVPAELETTVHVYIEGAPEVIESLWVDRDPSKVSVPRLRNLGTRKPRRRMESSHGKWSARGAGEKRRGCCGCAYRCRYRECCGRAEGGK